MEKLEKDNIEEEVEKTNPLKYILAIFLLFLLILMVIPYYGVKTDPYPKKYFTLQEIQLNLSDTKPLKNLNELTTLEISPEIRYIASKLSSSCEETSKPCNAKAIFYFVQNEIKYISDPLAKDYYQSPEQTLKSGNGDCDDKTILLFQLLKAVGIKSRLILTTDHVYLQAYLPDALDSYKIEDNWVNLDSTCDYCKFGEIPYEYTKTKRIYLN